MFCIVPRAVEVGSHQTGLFPSAMFFSFSFLPFLFWDLLPPMVPAPLPAGAQCWKARLENSCSKVLMGEKGGDLILKAVRGAFTFTTDTGPPVVLSASSEAVSPQNKSARCYKLSPTSHHWIQTHNPAHCRFGLAPDVQIYLILRERVALDRTSLPDFANPPL